MHEECKWSSLPCSYCITLLLNKGYDEWLTSSAEDDFSATFFPFVLVEYDADEGAPLYIDTQEHAGGKRKWSLVQGVGPQSLDMDKTHSGKVYKKSYRGSGLSGDFLSSVETQANAPRSEVVLPSSSEIDELMKHLDTVYWDERVDSVTLLRVIRQHFFPVLMHADALLIEMRAIVDDPDFAWEAFLQTYPLREEDAEELSPVPQQEVSGHKKDRRKA